MSTEHIAHTWTTHSTHDTSEGLVGYQGCRCGAQRIVTVPTHSFAPVAETAHRS